MTMAALQGLVHRLRETVRTHRRQRRCKLCRDRPAGVWLIPANYGQGDCDPQAVAASRPCACGWQLTVGRVVWDGDFYGNQDRLDTLDAKEEPAS